MRGITCIDLFCGAGGLTHGLISEGIKVVAGIDVDEACRYPYEVNNKAKFLAKDISKVTSREIDLLFGQTEIRVLAGCAPCQPFSTYANRYETIGTPRWGLLYQFARLVKGVLPEIITMENVPTVAKHAVFDDFVSDLRKLGYDVWYSVVDCADYGLPQKRRRMVLLASRLGPIELTKPKNAHYVTVRQAIGKLQHLRAGETSRRDPLHTSAKLSGLNLERIQASRPGGTWRDWPKKLVAKCHRRETGRTYPGVYGRMVWDEPSPTLTTQFYGFGNGRFGHPDQNRAITLREGAILQGFPETYSFVPDENPIHLKVLGRMIGNAVPVTLGRVVGRSIIDHLRTVLKKEKKNGGGANGRRDSIAA